LAIGSNQTAPGKFRERFLCSNWQLAISQTKAIPKESTQQSALSHTKINPKRKALPPIKTDKRG
jgi:hypothetical protein